MALRHTCCFSKRSVFSMIDESELSAFQPLRDSGGGVRSNGPGILPAVPACQDLLASSSARIYYSLNEEMRVCGKSSTTACSITLKNNSDQRRRQTV